AVGQGVLPRGRFAVIKQLLRCRLADVGEGQTVGVARPELGGTEGVIHGRPPDGFAPRGAGPGAGRGVRGVASAGRPAGAPTPAAGAASGPASASGAGGRDASCVSGHAVPPGASASRSRHNAASSSKAVTPIVTGSGENAPPPP